MKTLLVAVVLVLPMAGCKSASKRPCDCSNKESLPPPVAPATLEPAFTAPR